MKNINLSFVFFAILFSLNIQYGIGKDSISIRQDTAAQTVYISDGTGKLALKLHYSGGCVIDQLYVNGKSTLGSSGIYSFIKPSTEIYSSGTSNSLPGIIISDTEVIINNISFGTSAMGITEKWTLMPKQNGISWEIERMYNNSGIIDEIAMPVWNFANLSVWKGGILNNGGMVWCKYLANKYDTYGVHTNGVTFWNPGSGDGLRIESSVAEGKYISSKFFHNGKDEFSFAQYLSNYELQTRYNLNRFVSGHSDVFTPIMVKKELAKVNIIIKYINYDEEYPVGNLPGIDANAVRELRNTTARYGVVDQNIIGANGWITNWKCLHEPFFAQIGLFVNDENYTRNFSSTLDQERDLAITKDGRVLSRWHNESGDEMPGTYNFKTGYYETQWGFTIDSQTSYIINTAEQFDLNGDLSWLKGHKQSCENALEWLIKRDGNKNGLFEMMNDSYKEKKCSDWIDVVYASFENAFVNAQMYDALNQWVACEQLLGDSEKAAVYNMAALKLKKSFNKTVTDGGFWSPEKKCYIYWRDKDGTPHGDNLVTPVNFMAIAFGICDDSIRISEILENIESKMVVEDLFHWPLCFESFKREEVENVNWPFPNYENGDIFPSWGYLGVKSYVENDKGTALKYIKKLLEQYNKDGLSSQRFSRKTQEGLGSDILSGICTTITALYKDIYGVRPRWNRMGLEPNLSEKLNGTDFYYDLRGVKYRILLSENNYHLQSDNFIVKSDHNFGVNMQNDSLLYYSDNKEELSMIITRSSKQRLLLELKEWNSNQPTWNISSNDNYLFTINGLLPNFNYTLLVNGKSENSYLTDDLGKVSFKYHNDGKTVYKLIRK